MKTVPHQVRSETNHKAAVAARMMSRDIQEQTHSNRRANLRRGWLAGSAAAGALDSHVGCCLITVSSRVVFAEKVPAGNASAHDSYLLRSASRIAEN